MCPSSMATIYKYNSVLFVWGSNTQSYQPHRNTQKYTDSTGEGIYTHTVTFMQSAKAAHRSIHIKHDLSYVRLAVWGRGRGVCFCNMYTQISYITPHVSTFILCKQQTDSEPTCRRTPPPHMWRFCTSRQEQWAHVSANTCCTLLEPLRSRIY